MVELKKSKQETVKVIVRCRPLSDQEVESGHSKIVHMRTDRGQIELKNPKEQEEPSKDFTFDAIYDENSTQSMLYEETFRDLVDSVLNGYNATIFAYGQTGTGKTHTMEGKSDIPEQRGVIYKCIDHIFEHITNSINQEYLVRASYLEIYQEELRDLLSREEVSKKLDIKERPDGGVYVKDLSAFVTNSAEAIQRVMATGNSQRSVGRTNMNEHSSRSHAIFIITVECSQVGLDGENHITVGRLNLVDLAGSERQAKTGATGDRFKEATKINLSLSALGNVISALVDSKSSHVPYRDSKLTRLLQDSLGGNSKTVMVACIGPASYNYEETLGTLRYANRAKNIKNQPKINEDPKDALLREFQEEIQRLRVMLEARKSKAGKSSQSFYDEEQAKLESDMEKIMKDDNIIRQEKEKLINQLEEKAKMLEKERMEQARVAEQIMSIQSRLISGEGGLESRTKEQQEQLERRKKELAAQKRREREMAELLEKQEEDTVDLRQTFSDLKGEVEAKTKKLKKLVMKLRQTQNEIRDTGELFSKERQGLDQSIGDINKELKLKLLIVENFIPRDVTERIKERAEWDEDDSCWNVHSYSKVPPSTSSSGPLILGENDDGVLIRSSGADSGVSVGSSPSTSSQFLDKRLVATPGVRRPMSICERVLIERTREQLSGQRRPPISGNAGFADALIPEETIRFCGENIVVFSGLERFAPNVTDAEPMSTMIDRRPSTESLTIDASKMLAPITGNNNSSGFLTRYTGFKKRVSPQRLQAQRRWFNRQKISNNRKKIKATATNIRIKTEEIENVSPEASNIDEKLNDSSDSEGICADIGSIKGDEQEVRDRSPSPSSRGSMTSSAVAALMHSSASAPMWMSSMETPKRPPSRIPGLMSRSLSSHHRLKREEEICSIGSREQLCEGYQEFKNGLEAEKLLIRSQEKRRIRASSFDPRCLFALNSSSGIGSSMMMSSSYFASSNSRLLPKRPQWVRHHPNGQMAETPIYQMAKRLANKKVLSKSPTPKIDPKKYYQKRGDIPKDAESYFNKFVFGFIDFCTKCQKNWERRSISKSKITKMYKLRRSRCRCSPFLKHLKNSVETINKNPIDAVYIMLFLAMILRIILFFSENFLFPI